MPRYTSTWLAKDPIVSRDVIETYANDRSAVRKLAAKYHTDTRSIYSTLRIFGVERRTLSQAFKGRMGPNSPGWKGGRNHRANGYIRIQIHGHPRADRGGYVREHIVIAETALGKPLPPKAQVHHVDEKRDNNENTNLVICQDRAYHALLHTRAKILRAGGNPNTDKLCGKCNSIKLRSFFSASPKASWCKQCQSAYYQNKKGVNLASK